MMTSNKRGVGCKALAGAIVVAVPSVATAEQPTAEQAPAITVAAEVMLLSTGLIEFEAHGVSASRALEPGFGFGGQVDYWITDGVGVGVAPRVVSIQPDDGGDSATQIDLVGRLQGRHTLGTRTRGIAFAGLGYSMLVMPDGDETPSGLLIDLGLAVRQTLTGAVFLQGHAGYGIGFQGGTVNGSTYALSTSGLHFGVGVGTAL